MKNVSIPSLWSLCNLMSSENSEGKIPLDLKREKIVLIDWQGKRKTLFSESGVYRLPVSKNPSFVIGDKQNE